MQIISSRTAAASLLVALSANVAPTAQAPRSSENVSGRVLIAGSQQPVARAEVSIVPERGGPPVMTAETDERGHFTLYEVPHGRYMLHATKGIYFGGRLGQRGLASDPPRNVYLHVPGLDTTGITLLLWPPPIITGTVTTDKGDPLAGVLVRAVRRTSVAGRSLLAPLANVRTDDRGTYRMVLRAGAYMVSATDSRRGIFYYPDGTSLASALPVAVNYGDERTGVDFVLPRQAGLSEVSGTIANWQQAGAKITLSALRFAKGDAPELSGTVRDEHGVTRGDATVYVFPSDRALWMDFGPYPTRLVKITTDRFGRYSVRLPPGSYIARAVIDEVADPWMEPETLGRLTTGATRIVLRSQGGTTTDLAIVQ